MEEAFTLGLMDKFMMGNGFKESNTARESTSLSMGLRDVGFGAMESAKNG
jgi:hypothetical protein